MKKEEAVDAIDRAGQTLGELSHRVWSTALNPRESGWAPTILSIAAIPVVNVAVIGQLVTSVIVKEVPPSVFDTVSNLGGKKEP